MSQKVSKSAKYFTCERLLFVYDQSSSKTRTKLQKTYDAVFSVKSTFEKLLNLTYLLLQIK